MNLSAKVEYAGIAVLELARHYGSGEPVRLRTIAESHGIPSPFLVQIMLQLKAAGLVESLRGASGGYQLTRDPATITLGQVREVIEGPTGLVSNLANETAVSQLLLQAWRRVEVQEKEVLSEITFSELVERLTGRAEEMYYI